MAAAEAVTSKSTWTLACFRYFLLSRLLPLNNKFQTYHFIMATGRHKNCKPEGPGGARLDEEYPEGIKGDPM